MSDWTDFLPFFPLRSQVGRVWAQSDFGPLVTEGVYNWNPAYLRRTAKALADVRSGKARAVINYLGDSGVMGAGRPGNRVRAAVMLIMRRQITRYGARFRGRAQRKLSPISKSARRPG